MGDVVLLEQGAAAAEDLSSGSAGLNAAAMLWPAQLKGLLVPHREREPWPAAAPVVAWADADPWPVEHRPRG